MINLLITTSFIIALVIIAIFDYAICIISSRCEKEERNRNGCNKRDKRDGNKTK